MPIASPGITPGVFFQGSIMPTTVAPVPYLGLVSVSDVGVGKYATIAASQTNQTLGTTGAKGDDLAGILIIPATTSPGAVSIADGGGPAITIFAGGASSVSSLVPFFVPLGVISVTGVWTVTTGANVSAVAVGAFT